MTEITELELRKHAMLLSEQSKEDKSFFSKLVGVTFNDRQKVISGLFEGEILQLVRQPDNEFDKNAIIALRSDGKEVGHISREIAYSMASNMDAGNEFICIVKSITGKDDQTKGVNIEVTKTGELIKHNCFTCGRTFNKKEEAESCCKR